MDSNSNTSSAHAALNHAIAAFDACINFLNEARARIAAELPPAQPKPPAENFTPVRLQQAYATQARIEDEIADAEERRNVGDLNATADITRLEDMLEHVLRFIDDCRAHIALKGDQPNRKARRAAKAQGIDATYEAR